MLLTWRVRSFQTFVLALRCSGASHPAFVWREKKLGNALTVRAKKRVPVTDFIVDQGTEVTRPSDVRAVERHLSYMCLGDLHSGRCEVVVLLVRKWKGCCVHTLNRIMGSVTEASQLGRCASAYEYISR